MENIMGINKDYLYKTPYVLNYFMYKFSCL